jgi:hypothetical protein
MKADLMDQLPRTQREAVESAGYRVIRWAAARRVLQARVAKNRVPGTLGEFLAHWLPNLAAGETAVEFWLSFEHAQEEVKLAGGSIPMVNSPVERGLLHLPALRAFWNQELRQQHFAALRSLVPCAWLLDDAAVPPGAVIEGLNAVSWDRAEVMSGQGLRIQSRGGQEDTEWREALAGRESILTATAASRPQFKASYLRNDEGQVVLHSIEAASS